MEKQFRKITLYGLHKNHDQIISKNINTIKKTFNYYF